MANTQRYSVKLIQHLTERTLNMNITQAHCFDSMLHSGKNVKGSPRAPVKKKKKKTFLLLIALICLILFLRAPHELCVVNEQLIPAYHDIM